MKKLLSSKLFYIIVLLTVVSVLNSQTVLVNEKNSLVNELYEFPWAGGMDAIQYCEIDVNIDGINDLVAFDRRGNRTMCFINNGTINSIDYTYEPEYNDLFPAFSDWVIMVDYNMDGKNDIFTYSPGYGSMMVYRNVSDNILKFERVVYPYLKTLLPGGYVNLFVTNADYPGIADVDNDGDLDILTFGVLGSFVDMHKNMSMEKYGTPDSLDYEHYTYCWGHFAESDESNELYFDTCFGGLQSSNLVISKRERHTGSTFLLHDFDDNGQVDLLLGDVDYPKSFALYNTGTNEDADITSYDTLFPHNTHAIWMFSMPCSAYIDVNNDGVKDLIVSPFDPGIETSQNRNSSWLYINDGSNNLPNFEYPDVSFLQKNMIDVGSGAYPVLYDWDEDGLLDLFVGNYGDYKYSYYINYTLHSVFQSKITYFKNVGTNQKPVFQMWDDDFAQLGSLNKQGLIPAFEDINGDGYTDLLVGDNEGIIVYVKNNQDNNFEVIDENFMNIDVGEYSSPQLFDLDRDGDKDLIIGEKGGNINYYRNIQDNEIPEYEYVTDSLGKVNVTNYALSYDGYSIPSFFVDQYQNTGLLVGSEEGKVFYFTDIDNNLEGKFTESAFLNQLLDTTNVNFDHGMRTGAAITNLYSNDKLEMIVGNYSGGLEYFNGGSGVNSNIDNFSIDSEFSIFPNPAQNNVIIKFGGDYEKIHISIYNTNGIQMYSEEVTVTENQISLNIEQLGSGVYIVKARIGNMDSMRKLIIQR